MSRRTIVELAKRRLQFGLSLAAVGCHYGPAGCSRARIFQIEHAAKVEPKTVRTYRLAIDNAIAWKKRTRLIVTKVRLECGNATVSEFANRKLHRADGR